jgi:hypothetical protein
MIVVEKKCEPAPIPDYCMSEKSFVTFKCKEGFKFDEIGGIKVFFVVEKYVFYGL